MENGNLIEKNRNTAITIVAAALVVLSAVLISLIFNLDIVQNLVMGWILTVFYAIFAFLIFGNYGIVEVVKEVPVEKEVIKFVEKPIQVPVQIPVENKTIEVVEKPVIRTVILNKKEKKLNIPRYNFVASTETKTYHKRNCRLGKLIKKKYKISNNSKSYFKKKHFKACKVCLKR